MHKPTKEVLMALPNLFILLGRLAADERIPRESKLALAAATAYFVSPIDLVPDFIPVLGQFDDLIALLVILDGVLNHLDPNIIREHWRGNIQTLEFLSRWSRALTSFVPNFIKERLFHRSRLQNILSAPRSRRAQTVGKGPNGHG